MGTVELYGELELAYVISVISVISFSVGFCINGRWFFLPNMGYTGSTHGSPIVPVSNNTNTPHARPCENTLIIFILV